jgi:hypothetical protein
MQTKKEIIPGKLFSNDVRRYKKDEDLRSFSSMPGVFRRICGFILKRASPTRMLAFAFRLLSFFGKSFEFERKIPNLHKLNFPYDKD